MQQIELLNGAFTATLEKGKWTYSPNLPKVGKKKEEPKKESMREQVEYPIIETIEKHSSGMFMTSVKSTVLDIVKHLKGK